jgi:hypothetical protein
MAASALTPPAAGLAAAVQRAAREGRPTIILGRSLSPTLLHWVLATSANPAGVAVLDPWGGVRTQDTWATAVSLEAGLAVTVTRAPSA